MEDIPDDENGAVLRRLRSSGDSLRMPRDIDFSVVFADEDAARAFCDAVRSEEWHVEYHKSRTNKRWPWDVTATRHMVPGHADIGAMEGYLESIAAPLGGRNDGWGCFGIKDMQPE